MRNELSTALAYDARDPVNGKLCVLQWEDCGGETCIRLYHDFGEAIGRPDIIDGLVKSRMWEEAFENCDVGDVFFNAAHRDLSYAPIFGFHITGDRLKPHRQDMTVARLRKVSGKKPFFVAERRAFEASFDNPLVQAADMLLRMPADNLRQHLLSCLNIRNSGRAPS